MTIHCTHCPDYDTDNMKDQVKETIRRLGRSDSDALTKPRGPRRASRLTSPQAAWLKPASVGCAADSARLAHCQPDITQQPIKRAGNKERSQGPTLRYKPCGVSCKAFLLASQQTGRHRNSSSAPNGVLQHVRRRMGPLRDPDVN